MELKQSMVVSPDPFLDECFIKKPISRLSGSEQKNDKGNDKGNMREINSEKNIQNNINDVQIKEINNSFVQENNYDDLKLEFNAECEDDIEEINMLDIKENEDELKEIDVGGSFDNNLEPMTLKKPNQVYYNIYKAAREKAKKAKKEAILAFLEAKNIKTTYMLEGISDSDSDIDNELDSLEEL